MAKSTQRSSSNPSRNFHTHGAPTASAARHGCPCRPPSPAQRAATAAPHDALGEPSTAPCAVPRPTRSRLPPSPRRPYPAQRRSARAGAHAATQRPAQRGPAQLALPLTRDDSRRALRASRALPLTPERRRKRREQGCGAGRRGGECDWAAGLGGRRRSRTLHAAFPRSGGGCGAAWAGGTSSTPRWGAEAARSSAEAGVLGTSGPGRGERGDREAGRGRGGRRWRWLPLLLGTCGVSSLREPGKQEVQTSLLKLYFHSLSPRVTGYFRFQFNVFILTGRVLVLRSCMS